MLRRPLTLSDVTAVYVGLRPLVTHGGGETAAVSREHEVRRSAPGLVSVAGGKYTTYRLMARDAVDVAAARPALRRRASRTQAIPLLGAAGARTCSPRRACTPRRRHFSTARLQHLAARYGTLAAQVLDLVSEDPALAAPLAGADEYLAAEVRYATALRSRAARGRRAHATHAHRLRGTGQRPPGRGRGGALMAPCLGWDEATRAREMTHYRARLDAESAAQVTLDDAASAAARAPVQDVRLTSH